MYSKRLLIIIFILAGMKTYAFDLPEKDYPQITGAQIFVLKQEPDLLFAELKNKGINTVFFRVFHNKADRLHMGLKNPCPEGGVYFASGKACTVAPIFEEAVAAAHRQGIQIYAWMATRSLSFLKTPENMAQVFSPAGGKAAGYGASIFKKEVRQTITGLFQEIALTGADGILIQDDFILKYNEGVEACGLYEKDSGNQCVREALFRSSQSGRLIPDKNNYDKWASWKADRLSGFFMELRRDVRLIAPEMKWAVNIYYESPVYPDKGLSWYSHNLEWLMEAGADYLAVMAYQEQIASELSLEGENLLEFAGSLADSSLAITDDPKRIIFKLQTRPFYGGKITSGMRAEFYNTLSNRGGQSFVELPVEDGEDIMITSLP